MMRLCSEWESGPTSRGQQQTCSAASRVPSWEGTAVKPGAVARGDMDTVKSDSAVKLMEGAAALVRNLCHAL